MGKRGQMVSIVALFLACFIIGTSTAGAEINVYDNDGQYLGIMHTSGSGSTIEADPFDNLFLALASENRATLIVSGDRHLLDLESFDSVQIVTPSQGVQIISHLLSLI